MKIMIGMCIALAFMNAGKKLAARIHHCCKIPALHNVNPNSSSDTLPSNHLGENKKKMTDFSLLISLTLNQRKYVLPIVVCERANMH